VATVEIYSNPMCPYCARAKSLLAKKGVSFTDFDIWALPGKREEMIQRAGGRTTVPQIFINGAHVGGCDDLHDLDRAGQLDMKLAG
jgi:glutaredoxin 3